MALGQIELQKCSRIFPSDDLKPRSNNILGDAFMYKKIKSSEGYYSAQPLPTPADLTEHYSAKYYEAPQTSTYQINYSENELAQKKLRADLCIFAISEVLGNLSDKSLFEIGFGEGYILKSAANAGMEISGVDFTDSGLQTTHPELSQNVEVSDAYQHIDNLIVKNVHFDACVIQNVLEHVIDPILMIKKIKAILKPNGYVIINVPNDYSDLQLEALKTGLIDREFWFGPIEHLHYFNTENLPKFVESHGFEVCDAYGDFPVDFFLMNSHSNYVMDRRKGKEAHNARVTLDLLMAKKGLKAYHRFCQSLSGVGVGRNICLIAKKTD